MAGQQHRSDGDGSDRIDLDAPEELARWARKFGVSDTRLREVVAEVGRSAKAVEEHLRSGRA